MAFIPTPNTVRVVFNFNRSTIAWSNVLHFYKLNFNEADMVALANTLDNACGTTIKTHLANNCTYANTTVYDVRTIDGPLVVDSGNSGLGSQVGVAASLNCNVVVTLRTNARGRTGRGRVYVAGFLDNALENDAWNQNAADAATDWISALRANAGALGWLHVIRSIQADGVTLNPAVTREVTGFDVRSLVTGTQRRRVDRA